MKTGLGALIKLVTGKKIDRKIIEDRLVRGITRVVQVAHPTNASGNNMSQR